MNSIWSVDPDDMMEFFKLAGEIEKDLGRVMTRDERELLFLALMQEKDIKPVGSSEMSQEEFLKFQTKDGKSCLEATVDENGKTVYKIYRPKEENQDE